MTVRVDLTPEIEAGLRARAQARGISLEDYVQAILQGAVTPRNGSGKQSLARLFAESPLKGLELKFERDPDPGRRSRAVSRFLLDTNVPSELTRQRSDPNVEKWLDEADNDELFLSVISLGEILKGLTVLPASKRRRELESWVNETLRLRAESRRTCPDATR